MQAVEQRTTAWPVASLLSLAVGVTAVAVLFWIFGLDELAAALQRTRLAPLILVLCVGACVRLGYALRWRFTARSFAVSAPLWRFVQARLAGDALGTILPTGRISGDPLRIVLLRTEGEKVALPTASVALDRFMEWIGNALCATGCVSIFIWSRAAATGGAGVSLIIGLLAVLAFLSAPLFMLRIGWRPFQPLHRLQHRVKSARVRRWLKVLYDTETQLLELFRERPVVFVAGALASVLIELVILLEYHLLLSAFAIDVDWPTLLMVVVTGGLARAVPTPAGLGALEAGEVGLLAVTAGDPALGFVIGIVIRLHEFFWTALGCVALAQRGGLERLRSTIAAGKRPA